jgi:hypothetical protein
MTQTNETRAAVGSSGLGDTFASTANSPQDSPRPSPPQVQFAAIQRLRRQRLVESLHRLGPAPLGHFLNEIEAGAIIAEHLERYARIDPDFVRALNGDRFPAPLHVVDGGRRS